MTEAESWQGESDDAEIFENLFVPTLFGPWAPQVADAAGITAGDRVLDVGCGTGILAREAVVRVGSTGSVTGLDLNEGMLAVARRTRPDVDWRLGDAQELPFDDESFDVVVSQFALMYFPDRVAALKEMKRVLAPEGRLAIAVWGPFERATGYVTLAEIATPHAGDDATNILKAPHVLGDEGKLASLFDGAGFASLDINLRGGFYTQSSIDLFVEAEVKGSPLEGLFDEESFQAFLEEASKGLQPFLSSNGEIVVPMDAIIVTARKEASYIQREH
ncbi:MAG: methyltransferase domain-containing protein [Chloroflexota bacterium]|nr:MAG: methyltransferase domain-containing protein [Chloroflexota bacterium]